MARTESLSSIDIARIKEVNRHLSLLEIQLLRFIEEKPRHPCRRPSADIPQRLGETLSYIDFEKEAEITCYLREDDPCYVPDGDNILAKRGVSLSWRHPFLADGEGHTDGCSELSRHGISPVCYLFNELYDASYGRDAPKLTLRDISRIGYVWIDITTIDQFELRIAANARA